MFKKILSVMTLLLGSREPTAHLIFYALRFIAKQFMCFLAWYHDTLSLLASPVLRYARHLLWVPDFTF
jgi:hypothetical protein